MKTKASIPDLEKQNGLRTSNDNENAEVLNEFFSSVFMRENLHDIPAFPPRPIKEQFKQLHITPDMVKQKLKKLKPNKTPGMDGIHPRVLCELKEEVAEPLADFMNKTLMKSELPQEWKDAMVTPIYKKGAKSTAVNYRPVSLTSVVCKVTESIIRDQVMKHLVNNELLTSSQHGFVAVKSCTTQLTERIDSWTNIIEKGRYLDVVYLDFAKAFNNVAHNRLIRKLEGYGINGEILNWIQNFLTGRRQLVAVYGVALSWADVLSGVPQESVLGPLLFVVYINDLPEEIDTMVRMFADDTKIFVDASSKANRIALQEDIIRLINWAKKWQLSFIVEKCQKMHIGGNNPRQDYTMEHDEIDSILEKTEVERDLGVCVDQKLKCSTRTEIQTNKANKIL